MQKNIVTLLKEVIRYDKKRKCLKCIICFVKTLNHNTLYMQLLTGHSLIQAFFYTYILPVWLRNRFISAELKPVLCHTEKSCIESYDRQFSTNIKIKIIIVIPFFILTFIILLSLIGCDK